MACTSGSVEKVVKNTGKAKKQIDRLQKMIEDQAEQFKTSFFKEIDHHLKDASINDAREVGFNMNIKTEYTSEFSLDKVAEVIKSALIALKQAQDPTIGPPALSPAAIEAYVDVVNSVAEAAKSSSAATGSLSFSMNRLTPGMFAFLSASSVNIKDKDTFGSEAVTTTAIYYRFMQSIDDVKLQTEFVAASIDAQNLIKMKKLQGTFLDELANGDIDLEAWMKKDEFFTQRIEQIRARLKEHNFEAANIRSIPEETLSPTPQEDLKFQKVIQNALSKLSEMGDEYKAAIEISKSRLAQNYYQ